MIGQQRHETPTSTEQTENPLSTKITLRRSERGQAIVEFALVANVLLLLVLGIAKFGVIFSQYIAVTDAAREGARQASIHAHEGSTAAQNAARSAALAAAPNLKSASVTVTTTSQSGVWGQGEPISVRVRYPYTLNVLGIVVKSGNLESTTVWRGQ